MQIPFALQSYQSRAIPLSQQGLVNAYLEIAADGSKTQTPILGTPGIRAVSEVGTKIRGAKMYNDQMHIVSGEKLYRVSPSGIAVEVGDVPGTDRVSMAAGEFLAIASHDRCYFYDGLTVARVTDVHFQGARQVEWLAGYYIYLKPDTDVFYISAVENPNDVEALDWATAEAAPDNTVAILVDHNDLFLFGKTTTEIWGLRTGGTFPLVRYSEGVIEHGCAAANSPAKVDNTVFWLGDDLTVRSLRGGQPQRISTEAMEVAFSRYAAVDDAIGMALTAGGRITYVLTFPTERKTWQYSVNTGMWNELESYNQGRWQVDGVIRAYHKNYVWDTTNRLGEIDFDTYSEWGEILPFRVRSAPVTQGSSWLFHKSLYLDFEVGHQTVSEYSIFEDYFEFEDGETREFESGQLAFIEGYEVGIDRDPVVMLRWSDDARNWGATYVRSLGRAGEYRKRVAFTQSLGRAAQRVYELTITDPVKRHFLGAEGEVRLGGH